MQVAEVKLRPLAWSLGKRPSAEGHSSRNKRRGPYPASHTVSEFVLVASFSPAPCCKCRLRASPLYNLHRALSPTLGLIKVSIEAHYGQIKFLGRHVLVGIVEIEVELLCHPD